MELNEDGSSVSHNEGFQENMKGVRSLGGSAGKRRQGLHKGGKSIKEISLSARFKDF